MSAALQLAFFGVALLVGNICCELSAYDTHHELDIEVLCIGMSGTCSTNCKSLCLHPHQTSQTVTA